MSTDPLVSILIPAFNAQEFLADAIRSALEQTCPRKEVIVVDDGSRDQTLAIARQFESRYVKVVTQSNQGAAATRNAAYALSQGDYIQWLDADDLLSRDKVKSQMEVADGCGDPRTLLSSGWGNFTFRPRKAKFIPTPLWCDLSPLEWLTRKWEYNAHMQTATWLVSRHLTDLAGPWNTTLLNDDDGEYFFRVVAASSGVRFVSEGSVCYRIVPSNRLSYIGRSERKMNAHFSGMKLQIGYLLAMEKSARTCAACVQYLQTWLPVFYPERPDIVQEATEMARQLGGDLKQPRASWKYRWLEKLCGARASKIVQQEYNQWKIGVLRSWDRLLYSLEGRRNFAELG